MKWSQVRRLHSMLAMTHLRQALWAASTLAAALFSWNTASACGAPPPAKTTAYPTTGASNVSPMTSIKLVLGQTSLASLSLSSSDSKETISLAGALSLGSGFHKGGYASFWLFNQGLSPSTEYVLRDTSNGTTVELTRFTTAPSYDKVQGPAAPLESLRLWRVRYPLSQIAAGGCIFAEYEGYIELKFPPAVLPGTPDDEVVQVVQLSPKTGGLGQSQVYTGNTTSLGTVLGDDGYPAPYMVKWKPELSPDREYCATVSFYGRNDLALLPLRSSTICASVIVLDRSQDYGSGVPPTYPPAHPGTAPDASSSDGLTGMVNPADTPSSSSSGCSYVPTRSDAGLWLMLGLALVGRLRRAVARASR